MTSVVIIGGGVIGLSLGWRAAQRGLAVTVADATPGQGASFASAGMLAPAAEAAYAEQLLYRLGTESLRRYPDFISELTEFTGCDTGFSLPGSLLVGYDSGDLALVEEKRALQERFGAPGQWLTGRECRALEPLLAPGVGGGLFMPGQGAVDPRLLTRWRHPVRAAGGRAGPARWRGGRGDAHGRDGDRGGRGGAGRRGGVG